MKKRGVPRICVLAWSCLLGSAVAAGAAAVTGAAVPLLHAVATERYCALAFPAIPDQQVCINLAFADTDLWVFHDSTVLVVSAYETAGFAPAQVPPTPLAATVQRGRLTSTMLGSLETALGAVAIGDAVGACNPLPPITDVPANFPQADLHYRITWFGKGFRSNVLELGTEYPDLCPPALQNLVTMLVNLPGAVFPRTSAAPSTSAP